jgi:hypothetical protein
MILNKFGLKKSFTLEVVPTASATQTTWQFPDIPFLREKYITGISASTNIYGVTSGKGNICKELSLETTICAFLTLVDSAGKQFIQNMPLDELLCQGLQQVNNSNVLNNFISSYNSNGLVCFKPVNIVWTKCFVYFPVATALTNRIAQFNIYYQDQK